ncbi:flagellar motor switch protein FliN [Nocardioides aequoreus]|uniref:flagellar motor switch protein FliN n=1 Tax=Nocardioides aequoreus TaxID=397278 RepID=UPI0006897238|nr:flagellar motor switch protein FliN [Nocardioides aequoreus]
MTTAPTADASAGTAALELLARAAADAVATLPSVTSLTPAAPQPGDDQVAAVFPRALVADAVGASARVGLLVGEELAQALASQPGADLASTFQPALDAVGAALGVRVGAAQEVAPADVAAALGGAWSVVPLIGEGFAGGIVASDVLVSQVTAAPAAPEPVAASAAPSVPASAVTHEPTLSQGVTSPRPATGRTPSSRGIEMLHDVDMEVTVELGRTRMLVRDLLTLAPGDVVELDRAAGSPADLLVGGRLIARGEVVVVDEDFGLRITQIIEPTAG